MRWGSKYQGTGSSPAPPPHKGAIMHILKSKTAVLVLILSSSGLSQQTLGRDVEPIVPMGALAHAAATLEKDTGARP